MRRSSRAELTAAVFGLLKSGNMILMTKGLLRQGRPWIAVLGALLILGFGLALVVDNSADQRERPSAEVQASLQTAAVSGDGDAADMAVVWVHPTDPARSLILGGSKDESDGGLHVWEMDGTTELDFLAVGAVNSIDIRYDFPYDGTTIDLIGLTNRSDQEVQLFTVDPATREISPVGSHAIDSPDIYGFTLAHDRDSDRYYSIPNTLDGVVEQWEIRADGTRIEATKVRTIEVGSQTEGAVADDANGWLYIGEEETGIWRYGLNPASGSDRVAVNDVSDSPGMAADVEGLTLYEESDDDGYLIASSQGNNRFTVYEREPPHAYRGSFAIVANPDADIDDVDSTDGIFVTSSETTEQFPRGVFVAHDGESPGESTNYKLVSWEDIADALSL
jgi:3-phytase